MKQKKKISKTEEKETTLKEIFEDIDAVEKRARKGDSSAKELINSAAEKWQNNVEYVL